MRGVDNFKPLLECLFQNTAFFMEKFTAVMLSIHVRNLSAQFHLVGDTGVSRKDVLNMLFLYETSMKCCSPPHVQPLTPLHTVISAVAYTKTCRFNNVKVTVKGGWLSCLCVFPWPGTTQVFVNLRNATKRADTYEGISSIPILWIRKPVVRHPNEALTPGQKMYVYKKILTYAFKFSWNWRFRPNIFHTNFRCARRTWHGHEIFTLLRHYTTFKKSKISFTPWQKPEIVTWTYLNDL